MASKLFSLFDDSLKLPTENVAGTPQSLATISSRPEEQNYVVGKLRQFEVAESKVDYSDFSNFVFFNSALDYFNITAEKIINEYPYDASRDVLDNFVFDLDPYQRWLVSVWPKNTGHLRFNPSVSSSYVLVVDVGQTIGDTTAYTTQQVGTLSPGTGSVAVEFWCNLSASLSQSNGVTVVFQKVSASGDGYTVYASGGLMIMRVVSGSTTSEVSAPFVNGQTTYYSFVYDRTNALAPVMTSYTGSATQFPAAVSSASSNIAGNIFVGNPSAYVGSGSLGGKTTLAISGALDELRVWQKALQLADLSGTYNVQAYAQAGLSALWHFNESGSINPDDGNNALVLDSSGHRTNGKVMNYYRGLRGSGSLLPYGQPDLMLQAYFNSPEVQSIITKYQNSGSDYDRDNDNIITRMVPENFLNLEAIAGTNVLQNFLYILARNFDYIKVRIDQFTKVLRSNYTQFDQAPDALLADVAKFFGWEFTGNFLSADAFQYLLGKNILANQAANQELDVKLYQIKNEFWKRTLVNLMYLYKTKGTREGVESFLRIYGVNKNFVRLKEYGYKPFVGIQTNRIHAEKSVYVMAFTSASLGAGGFPYQFPIPFGGDPSGSITTLQALVSSAPFSGTAYSVETRVNFPTTASLDNVPILATGSIWTLNAFNSSGSEYVFGQLYWTKKNSDPSQSTGSLYLVTTEGTASLTGANIFDNRWYNIVTRRDPLSGTLNLEVRRLNYDEIDLVLTSSVPVTVNTGTQSFNFVLGATGSYESQMWAQEVRVWNKNLTLAETIDHTLNFQSFGTETVGDVPQLAIHWRLRENVTASVGTSLPLPAVQDFSLNNNIGSTLGFPQGVAPYEKFLLDYNYIASPEWGWNEDKIRVFDTAEIKPADVAYDNQALALEFNMVDALNEDISQMIATMNGFNNAIGLPANRYRGTYQDIESLKRQYFQRLQGRLNFRVFADMLEFFDRSFIKMVQRLLPARAVFLGDEFVVESHMLERPKLQWNYRRQPAQFLPEGSITIWDRS